MGLEKGIITAINASTPKDFGHGNTSINKIIVNGNEYTIFVSERNGEYVLKDKDYKVVTQGMDVEFMYEENDKGKKIAWKTFKASGGAQTQQVAQQPTQQEKVPQNAPNDLSGGMIDALAMGMASTVALVKFRGKEMPIDILEKLPRMATDIKKRYL